jgi:isopentenyl-diphosphate Delta-isomerase
MAKEILDIVDLTNHVIWKASREEVYEKKYIHRIVHIIIRNQKGEFLMQLRSAEARYLPLHWSTSVGGHVQSGEDFEMAARREMIEEIGISDIQLTFRWEYFYEAEGLQKFLGVFEWIVDDGFVCNPDEVADVHFMSHDEFTWLLDKNVHPELQFLWKKLYQWKS